MKGSAGISRRMFLGAAGAALAAPYIFPSAAKGANSRINIGVVGTGGQAEGLTKNAMAHKHVRVIALCDVDKSKLAKAKELVDKEYDNTESATYADYRELLARKDIDAVIVATPDHWHALVCVEAAKQGKDIYCEKPLTWSLGEGRAVVKAVRDNKRVFQVGSMQRSSARFKRACEIVRNGYLGNIQRILVALPDNGNAEWVDEYPAPPPEIDWDMYVGPAQWAAFHPKRYHWHWRWWMGFGGGQMMDWIGHHGDIAHMAMDWDNTGPEEVEGVRWDPVDERNNLYDAPGHYMFRCKYKGGIEMIVGSGSDMPDEIKAHGTNGAAFIGDGGKWLYVDREKLEASDKKLLKPDFKKTDFRFRKEGNHMTDFLDCIASREECIAPVNAGHRSASIGHLGKIACILGARFKWDPAKEEITDNPALNGMITRRYRGNWKLEV